MYTVAVYVLCQQIDFLKCVEFKTEAEVQAFKLALDLNSSYADPDSDTSAYLVAHSVPEELHEIQEFDAECRWRKGKFFPGRRTRSKYYKKLLEQEGESYPRC